MEPSSFAGSPEASRATIQPAAALASVIDLEEYRQRRAAHILRTPEAMRWFVRQHSVELVKEGAMLKLANKWHAHADRFDQAIIRIGQRLAGTS